MSKNIDYKVGDRVEYYDADDFGKPHLIGEKATVKYLYSEDDFEYVDVTWDNTKILHAGIFSWRFRKVVNEIFKTGTRIKLVKSAVEAWNGSIGTVVTYIPKGQNSILTEVPCYRIEFDLDQKAISGVYETYKIEELKEDKTVENKKEFKVGDRIILNSRALYYSAFKTGDTGKIIRASSTGYYVISDKDKDTEKTEYYMYPIEIDLYNFKVGDRVIVNSSYDKLRGYDDAFDIGELGTISTWDNNTKTGRVKIDNKVNPAFDIGFFMKESDIDLYLFTDMKLNIVVEEKPKVFNQVHINNDIIDPATVTNKIYFIKKIRECNPDIHLKQAKEVVDLITTNLEMFCANNMTIRIMGVDITCSKDFPVGSVIKSDNKIGIIQSACLTDCSIQFVGECYSRYVSKTNLEIIGNPDSSLAKSTNSLIEELDKKLY